MKIKTIRGLLLLFVILYSGCAATSNLDRAETTTKTMEVVEQDINRISVELNETEASLNHLLKINESEMPAALEAYQKNVDDLIKLKQNLRHHSDQMREAGNKYFTDWEIEGETYANPELRELSTKRRQELTENFDQISETSGKISREVDAYINHLKEIESYLSKDLTPESLKAIGPAVENVEVNGKLLRQSIEETQLTINNTKPALKKLAEN